MNLSAVAELIDLYIVAQHHQGNRHGEKNLFFCIFQ